VLQLGYVKRELKGNWDFEVDGAVFKYGRMSALYDIFDELAPGIVGYLMGALVALTATIFGHLWGVIVNEAEVEDFVERF
jgi:hypothetical protein